MKCIADRDYTIHRSGMRRDGDITHITCSYCETFAVYKSEPGMKTSSADLGFYNRMRAKMVKHIHERHRPALNAAERRSLETKYAAQ